MLTQPHQTESAQRCSVVGALLQQGVELSFCIGIGTGIEACEGALDRSLSLPLRAVGTLRAQALAGCADGLIAGDRPQVLVIQSFVGDAGIQPQQGLSPGGAGFITNRGLALQLRQRTDALAPRCRAVGLLARQRQGVLRGIRIAGDQLAQTTQCFVPAGIVCRQYLVELQPQRVSGRWASERAPVSLKSASGVLVGRESPRARQRCRVHLEYGLTGLNITQEP